MIPPQQDPPSYPMQMWITDIHKSYSDWISIWYGQVRVQGILCPFEAWYAKTLVRLNGEEFRNAKTLVRLNGEEFRKTNIIDVCSRDGNALSKLEVCAVRWNFLRHLDLVDARVKRWRKDELRDDILWCNEKRDGGWVRV